MNYISLVECMWPNSVNSDETEHQGKGAYPKMYLHYLEEIHDSIVIMQKVFMCN